ncbi:MAG: prolyl-tRNA synthetase associated domain-containing protein [Candidatus Babeliales bacterium]
MNEKKIFDFFKQHNVPYHLYEHQPVFTVNEKPVVTAIDGVAVTSGTIPEPHFKTLFLQDNKGVFFLVSVIDDKRVDLKALSDVLGCARFSFGKAEALFQLLKLTPGSVTPYGLLFDEQKNVTFVLDEDALPYSCVSFHPMRNDMTIVTTPNDFLTCMQKMGHAPRVVRIPIKNRA